MIEIEQCSPVAAAKIKPDAVDTVGVEVREREKYPFSNMPIGWCFRLPYNTVKSEPSLRSQVTIKGKHLNKQFTVIKHGDPHNCYEIARIG